ncbi:MAG: SprT-like domain-containing protein [bacterium]
MILADARELARNEMDKNGLNDWHFAFDKSVSRFGVCNYNTKTIKLSLHLTFLNDADRVKSTILHEIAHALVGSEQGHNKV